MKAVRYRFGDYLLDAAARELWRGEERIAIPPKSLECLAYLLQHHGRAVGRDELIAAVWGRVDASDTLLTQTIWRARRAIGDDGDHNLRTVPRFGYRWVAPVRVEAIAESEAAGLLALKGHKAVGGMRASIYNAMPLAGVQALVDFMREFARRHG